MTLHAELVEIKLRFVETSVNLWLSSISTNSGMNNVEPGQIWRGLLIWCHIIVIGHESGLLEKCYEYPHLCFN